MLSINFALDCSNGPVSTMPGHTVRLVAPAVRACMTEGHEGVNASFRIQGETDSMGCEYFYVCAECEARFRLERLNREPINGWCDWHGGEGADIRETRDPDEGSAGPIYRVCAKCRTKASQDAAEELEELERRNPVRFLDDYEDDFVMDSGENDDMDLEVPESKRYMTSRVQRASKRIRRKAQKMAIMGANPDWSPYQGPTMRACIRHFIIYGEY